MRDILQRKQELAALLVHDLRNPLATILGNVQLLEEELAAASPSVKTSLADCRRMALRALGLVGTLLDVEELEEGLLVAHRVPVSIPEFLPECARHLGPDIHARRITLDVRVPEALSWHMDPDLVDRVVENLIDNSVRYSPVAGKVLLEARNLDGALEIRVGNNGAPIPATEADRIFGKYYRIEARRQGARSNRGLGLYFCTLVARAHGGSITIEPTAGKYATVFVLRLPAPPPSHDS